MKKHFFQIMNYNITICILISTKPCERFPDKGFVSIVLRFLCFCHKYARFSSLNQNNLIGRKKQKNRSHGFDRKLFWNKPVKTAFKNSNHSGSWSSKFGGL